MRSRPRPTALLLLLSALVGGAAGCSSQGSATGGAPSKSAELLNVSYDPTRELWKELNAAFIPSYEQSTGVKLTINQSHAASGTQALAIINGQPPVEGAASTSGDSSLTSRLLVLWPLYTSALAIVVSFWLGEQREKRVLLKHGLVPHPQPHPQR